MQALSTMPPSHETLSLAVSSPVLR